MILNDFNRKTGILYTRYEGIIRLDDMLTDIRQVSNDTHLPSRLKIITDTRDATYEIHYTDIPLLVDEVKKHIKKFDFVKEALLQNNSFITALSILYQLELSTIGNFSYKIFSTLEACQDWLNTTTWYEE